MHVIAAKAVAFGEALQPEFRTYAHQVVENARALAAALIGRGFAIVSGGTDTHLMLVDLRPKGDELTGKAVAASLDRANLTANYNGVPFDPKPPTITSGVRLGSPACTTRGLGVAEFRQIGEWVARVAEGVVRHGDDNSGVEAEVRKEVLDLCGRFPIYS
jgi:glycine hydroxymethyltransferase